MINNFKISPRILAHLGEDLIRSESIALFELIKNSYDACANHCIVEFYFQNETLHSITIEDDGCGMDQDLIENVWLVVGTDSKQKNLVRNQCGRVPLGEKGIGRLGIHKLGHKISLMSKMDGKEEVNVRIDWTKLHLAQTVEDFPIEVTSNNTAKHFTKGTGTKIVIKELKTNWHRRQLREVYRNITSLNSPFSDKNDSFEVIATSNDDVFSGLPTFDDIKDNALYFGHCKIQGNEIIDFKYEFRPWDSLEKVDEGRTVNLEDLIEPDRTIQDSSGNIIDLNQSGIGPIEFDIIIFDTAAQIFNFVNTEKKSLKDYLRANGGIRVYRDGVRVYNYGERDNDWLGIDLKRVQRVGGNVSNNIIVGAVKIDREHSHALTEKTNREGFIENKAYEDFVEAVNFALSLIVKERNVDKALLTNLYKKHKTIEPVLSDLQEVITIVETRIDEDELKFEMLTYLNRINNQYREVKEVLIKSANAGLNLGVVIHEIDKLIFQLTGFIERDNKEQAFQISKSLEKIIRGYSAMLKKSSIKEALLKDIVVIATDNYEFRFQDHSINLISNHNESELKAFYASSEAISILTNLLDNSIFWLSYARKKDRFISIFLTNEFDGYNTIVVSDNGPGFNIPKDVALQPFMTGKPHSIGSGLGLHVANEMIKAMKGKLYFVSDENEINFSKPVRQNKVTSSIIALCFPIEKK